MDSSLTLLERPAYPIHTELLLARNGFTCSRVTLEPGAETLPPTKLSPDDQVLFVLGGSVAVHGDGVTTIVNQGEASLLPGARATTLAARGPEPAQVLLVEIPPRQIVTPQIITR